MSDPADVVDNITSIGNAVDVIVVGSGAGGLTAAVTAARLGLKVVVLEKADHVGGTTAWSAGAAWLPGSRHLLPEDRAAPLAYLRNLIGNRLDENLALRMLDAGPEVVDFLEANTSVRFRKFNGFDYRTDVEGSSLTGRTLEPQPFDDRTLGPACRLMRDPLPSLTLFHGMQADNADLHNLQNAFTSWSSLRYSARLLLRHYSDLLRFGRSTRRLRGNALIAMLLKSALDLGVEIRTNSSASRLILSDGSVTGVETEVSGQRDILRARKGVVLATGGFSSNPSMRERRTPYAPQHKSLPPASNVGDGQAIATAAGARLGNDNYASYCFAPVSVLSHPDGSETRYPHFVRDRCKPGCIAVGAPGKRFVNEACSYHDFVLAMHATQSVPAFLICDHRFLRKYGLGLVRPFPFPYRGYLNSGYLVSAPTIAVLADKLAVDALHLTETIGRANEFARSGIDEDFGKGGDAFSRSQGDAEHDPNPCLGAIDRPPFYAIRLFPGDTGTTSGLATNADAEVLDASNAPIEGLYACGMDMNNPTMGKHPSSGCNIGPALVFGYLAAKHAASRSLDLTVSRETGRVKV